MAIKEYFGGGIRQKSKSHVEFDTHSQRKIEILTNRNVYPTPHQTLQDVSLSILVP